MNSEQPVEYAKIFIFLLAGFGFVYLLFFLSSLLAPKNPNAEKLMSYECGEEPTGNAWFQVNSRFYVIALIFLLFDVEMVFIFPWSTIFANEGLIAADSRWGWLSFIEMLIFISILMLGLIYLWIKGDLEWIKPEPVRPTSTTAIPLSAYNKVNSATYQVRPFSLETNKETVTAETIVETPAPKPAFKPVFRRPAP